MHRKARSFSPSSRLSSTNRGWTAWVLAASWIGGIPGAYAAALLVTWEHQPVGATAPVKQTLLSSEVASLQKEKQRELSEKDPHHSEGRARFQGPSLSALVDRATEKLTPEQRARIDLVLLRSRTGELAIMPRAFLVKYPSIQLALKKDGKSLGDEAPHVILPVATESRIQKEGMLLDPLFVAGISEVVLTNYKERYGEFFLKRRTDPAAMRGEKAFMRNCLGCHAGLKPELSMAAIASPAKAETLVAKGHPTVKGLPPLSSGLDAKEMRSLQSYLEAYRVETAAK